MEPKKLVKFNWSDEYFETNYLKQFCYRAYPSYARCREACKAFLNFYVSGQISAPLMDVWLLTVFGIRAPQCYTDSTRLITPKTIDPTSTREFSSILDTAKIENFSEIAPIECGTFVAEITRLKAWYDSLWKDLDYKSVDDHDTVSVDAHGAMNFIGYIALIMIRSSTKDENKVAQHLNKFTAKRFMSFWQNYNYSILFDLPKPHPSFLKICRNSFTLFHPNCTLALTLLVGTYRWDESVLIRGVLLSACLLSQSMAGLGCVHWTVEAYKTQNDVLATLLSYCKTGKNLKTISLVLDFMSKYMTRDDVQITWRWANLFHRDAFPGLAIDDNIEYALTTMAIYTCTDPDSHMWGLEQFKGKYTPVQKAFCLIMAERIVKAMHNSFTVRIPGVREARKKLSEFFDTDHNLIIDSALRSLSA